jgi:ubiquinone/menaquinone biosynthesis C-methylase UbiE
MARTKREVKDSYNDLGGRLYDLRYEEEQRRKYETMLAEVEVNEREIILDDGCGTGLLFEYVDATIIGLDVSSGLLSMALSRIQKVLDRHLIQGDAENLPLRDHVFNGIFAITIIQNTPNPVKTLEEISRVGKAGTPVVITALKKAFSKESFRHLLESKGFEVTSFNDDEKLSDIIAISSLKMF